MLPDSRLRKYSRATSIPTDRLLLTKDRMFVCLEDPARVVDFEGQDLCVFNSSEVPLLQLSSGWWASRLRALSELIWTEDHISSVLGLGPKKQARLYEAGPPSVREKDGRWEATTTLAVAV